MNIPQYMIDRIKEELSGRKFIFYTLSGAHLYGFPSKDSDYDIRGCHILSLKDICRLKEERDVIEKMDGDFDFVSFDIKKELLLLLKNNSNVLEHIFAKPLTEGPEFKELRRIAEISLSKKIYEPYHGLAVHNYEKYILRNSEERQTSEEHIPEKADRNTENGRSPTVKKYLYVLRSQMAGIYALEKGKIEPDITVLNSCLKFPVVDNLIAIKKSGSEKELLYSAEEAESLISKLWKELDNALENSPLPKTPPEEAYEMADEFLLKCRGVI
ncbi:nucleotidyltransferase domain-containing protein [Methanoplanus limicola]|nr:nucleotidyltransferase domain-containing protein [Methanoplanus limicola]